VTVADCVSPHLATVAMLAEFCVRSSLECDHIQTRSVLDAKYLAVNRSSPQVPARIFLAVNVDVWSTHLFSNLELGEFIVPDSTCRAVVDLDWLVTVDLHWFDSRQAIRSLSSSE
jgi:hypothetical protein